MNYDKNYQRMGIFILTLSYPLVLLQLFFTPSLHFGVGSILAQLVFPLVPIGIFIFYMRLTKWRTAIDINDSNIFIRSDLWRYHLKLEDIRGIIITKSAFNVEKLKFLTNKRAITLNANAIEGGGEACRSYLASFGLEEHLIGEEK